MTHRRNNYDYADLIASGRGELSGPGNAQLPMPPMLMFDRITNISESGGKYGRGEMEAELKVSRDLWFFECHFGGDPVMPGCLGLDAMWQMLGFYLWWSGGLGHGRALGIESLKLFGQVLPNAGSVTYHIDIKRVIRSKLVLGVADGSLSVDGEVIYRAEGLKVGLFRQGQLMGGAESLGEVTAAPGD